jgi:ABC-type nitrate/sulfonate/bicarbonate transport system permease component
MASVTAAPSFASRISLERLHPLWSAAWPAVGGFMLVCGVWEWVVAAWQVPSYLLPSPSVIWHSIWFNHGSIFLQAAITGGEAIVGFAIGSLFGALLGVGFAYSQILNRAFLVYAIAANTIRWSASRRSSCRGSATACRRRSRSQRSCPFFPSR